MKVSVVIPVYNVEKYIDQCLLSVINQTYKNLEIIIIDDGSTDNSGIICDGYAKKDNRITVVHTANQGAANAKNEALDRISGDYFCFADSDDYYEPVYIETMLQTIENYNCQIVQCQFANVFLDKEEPYSDCNQVKVFSKYEFMKDFSGRWQDALLWNKMFRKDLLEDIRFSQHRYIDDEFFTYKLVLNADTIVEIPQVLYKYRMRKSSATKTAEAQKKILLDQVDYSTERYEYISEKHPVIKQHLLEYMVTVFIQIFMSRYSDKEVIIYLKKHIRKYMKDIVLGRYNYRDKIALFRCWFRQKKAEPVSENIVSNQQNFFE